jgi:hypothetical protein
MHESQSSGQATALADYPVDLTVDYPDQKRDRLSILLRVFLVIPIAVVLGLLSGGTSGGEREGQVTYEVAAPGILALPVLLMLLFRQKYPRWWFDWNVALTAFSYRVGAYLALLRDEYPATDDE